MANASAPNYKLRLANKQKMKLLFVAQNPPKLKTPDPKLAYRLLLAYKNNLEILENHEKFQQRLYCILQKCFQLQGQSP
jgi:hypothetical protein